MRVGYVGALLFPTGYSEAAREHLKALLRVNVNVVGILNRVPHPFLHNELIANDNETNEVTDFNGITKPEEIDVWVLHITPDTYRAMGKPTFAYSVWEVIGLPPGWASQINTNCCGLITASQFSADRFREGGVTVPIWVVPHPIDFERFSPTTPILPELQPLRDKYATIFYLNAQWMPRKGVEDVLVAYLTEFTPRDNVLLLAQVWRGSHSISEQRAVQLEIQKVRAGLNLPDNQPDIFLLGEKIDRWRMGGVYSVIDVHISGSRGESYCLPVFEAAAAAKPSITTGWGGQWDYLDNTCAYPVQYSMEPVHGLTPAWRHYNGTQWWAKVDIGDLRRKMRFVHENPEDRKQKGERAYNIVVEKMNHLVVGQQMKEILEKVYHAT